MSREAFIGGHIREEVKDQLDEDAETLDLSRSKLLDMILADYYGIEVMPPEVAAKSRGSL